MDLGLSGKVAIVGGSSKGMGRATAGRLAEEGARVTLVARGEAGLAKAAEEIAAATTPEQVLSVCADLSRAGDVDRVISETVRAFGKLDILVNNVGGPPPGLAASATEDQWRAALDQNFFSVQRMCVQALPLMIKQGGGRIVTILSYSLKEPVANLVLSNAVRMAALGFSKTLADEVGPDNITVNVVGPGAVMTERYLSLVNVWAKDAGVTPEEMLAQKQAAIPLRRIGKPEEMADLIAFLVSERASYITGAFIPLDGGLIRAPL
ncbi:MAG: 3-oxoacyl-[acyl-carrier protein] reductase [Chloroflexi bacterium]|jgi:3-oxoacyl-[acyl-carrier protein] reductase|nr:MAG: 3-oxoacyl-[acyl-carrier protein] reductase [Chloroflexota bacterium]